MGCQKLALDTIATSATIATIMPNPTGRKSKVLPPDYIKVLLIEQRKLRLSLPELNSRMACPFAWRTLQRALEGKPIWELNHEYIVQWTDKHGFFPPHASPADFKRAAAGDRDESNDEEPPAARLRSEKRGAE